MTIAYSRAHPAMRTHGLLLRLPGSKPARPADRRGWLLRVLACVVAFATAIVAIAACDLNQPWVKGRVEALVGSWSGLDFDYGSIRLRLLSGVDVDNLIVRSPRALRGFAPDLVRAGRLEVRWTPSALLRHGPRFQRIDVTDVAVAVVVDEHGRTSFDALGWVWPSVPLSHTSAQLLASVSRLARLDVARADVAMIRTRDGRLVERDDVRGIGATVTGEPFRGGWRVLAAIGSPGVPVGLDVQRERDSAPSETARARVYLTADATASALNVTCDLKGLVQSFVPSIEAGDWHAEAIARFEPDAGRTTIALARVSAAAGAGTAEASLEVPDEGLPIVRHAEGDVDVTRMLAWVPAGLLPVVAERAQLHYRIDSAIIGHAPRFAEGGGVHIDADLANAKVRTAAGVIDVDKGRLILDGRPAARAGMAVRGWQHIETARAKTPQGRLDAHDVGIYFDGERSGDGALTGELDLRFGELREQVAAATVIAHEGSFVLNLEQLYPSWFQPVLARGDVAVSADVLSLDASLPASRFSADSITIKARSRLDGHAPYGGQVDVNASGVEVFAGGRRLVARTSARVGIHLEDVLPDVDHPLGTQGVIHASVNFDQGRAYLDAIKRADAIAYSLRANARSLKGVRPYLSPALAKAADWDTMAIALRSSGRVERISSRDPQFEQDASVNVDTPAFRAVSARSLTLDLHSQGTMWHQQAVASLRLSALAIAGAAPNDDTVALSATLDRAPLSLRLQAVVDGRVKAQVLASTSFNRDARAVVYDLEGRLWDLARVAPLAARVPGLKGFDLSRLELGIAARGSLLGVVSNVSSGGSVQLEPDPLRTAAIEGTADVRVAKLRWARGDASLEVPTAEWHGEMRSDGARRTLEVRGNIDATRLRFGHHQVDLAGIAEEATATVVGHLTNPTIDLTQRATVRAVEQDLIVEYPVGDVTLVMSARRDSEGLLRISGMNVYNGSGGTTLAIEGGVDFVNRRRRLSMTADVVQNLEPLSAFPARFAGRGNVELRAKVESPDLSVFRTFLDLKLAGVHVSMPGARVEADSVDGEIPITLVFDAGHKTLPARPDVRLDPYAQVRLTDRGPLLRRSGFLSIGRISTPVLSAAPFIGNLELSQNVVSLRQFEMGVRGGWLAGECALKLDADHSTLDAHLRANGIQSSYGEPFDGNVALVVEANNRMIEGRAEVLRMGRRHLLDLLDMEDPLRLDASMNRVRGALDWGYPKRIHVALENGYASAHIELGGLAQFISLGDIGGVPTGPIVDRIIAAVLDGKAVR